MKLSLAGNNKPGLQKGKQPAASKTATTNAFGQVKSSSSSNGKKPAIFGDDDDDDDDEGESRKVDIGGKPLSKLEQRKQADPSRLAQGLRGSQTTTSISSSPSTASKGTAAPRASASNNSRILAKMHAEAQAIDPSVFSYDEVYDSMKHAQKVALDARKAEKEAEGDAPKYVSGLLKAAELRKKDRIRAEDKLIERERQKEGDEFEDKDAFVTQAYKEQQVELRKLEEDEQKKEELAAKRPGGMSEYYKRELANSEAIHEAAMKAATEAVTATASSSSGTTATPSSSSSSNLLTEEEKRAADMAAHGPRAEAEIAAEASKALGRNVTVNEEGQIVDKRELLTGGLNLLPRKAVQGPAGGPPKGFALSIAERRSAQDEVQRKEEERKKREDEASLGMTGLTMAERQKLSRERQSKELERQMLLAQEKKRKAEEEKSSHLEKKVKAKRNDETKIEELKRKALERRMQKKQQEEEAAQATSAGQSTAA